MLKFAVVLLLALTVQAYALPPSGVDPDSPTSKWYQSLTVPGTGGSCCSLADCRHYPISSATDADGTSHYTVLFEGNWLPVPKEAVLDRLDNPTGDYVTCINAAHFYDGVPKPDVLCLIKAPRT